MIQIPLKAGHNWPASETPFKWHFACVPMMANIEFWHASFVIFQGIRTSIAKKPYFCDISGGGGSDVFNILGSLLPEKQAYLL